MHYFDLLEGARDHLSSVIYSYILEDLVIGKLNLLYHLKIHEL